MVFTGLFTLLELLLQLFAAPQNSISSVYPCLQYCTAPIP